MVMQTVLSSPPAMVTGPMETATVPGGSVIWAGGSHAHSAIEQDRKAKARRIRTIDIGTAKLGRYTDPS